MPPSSSRLDRASRIIRGGSTKPAASRQAWVMLSRQSNENGTVAKRALGNPAMTDPICTRPHWHPDAGTPGNPFSMCALGGQPACAAMLSGQGVQLMSKPRGALQRSLRTSEGPSKSKRRYNIANRPPPVTGHLYLCVDFL